MLSCSILSMVIFVLRFSLNLLVTYLILFEKFFGFMARYFIYNNVGSIHDTISYFYSGNGNRFNSLFEVFNYLANLYSLDFNSIYLRYYSFDKRIPAHVYMISHRDQSNSFSFLSFLVEVYF